MQYRDILSVIVLAALLACCGEEAAVTPSPVADATALDTGASPGNVADSGAVSEDAAAEASTDLSQAPEVEARDAAGVDTASEPDTPAEDATPVDEGPPPPECLTPGDCVSEALGPCEIPTCEEGVCNAVLANNGAACTTGNACLLQQTCMDGECGGGIAPACDDANPCTEDSCDPVLGCQNESIPDCCVPNCAGKECGTDGCGGVCGSCPEGSPCIAPGVCDICVPDCEGKTCGDNGCGSSCGSCGAGQACQSDFSCAPCNCNDKECGDDGCGNSCGQCPDNTPCVEGVCGECVPDCNGKACGDDGCGGSCGSCPEGEGCSLNFTCEPCAPQCEGLDCGADGCGGVCGLCGESQECISGLCVDPAEGDTCAYPFNVTTLPYSKTADTTLASPLFATQTGDCNDSAGNWGAASNDHIYSFSPSATGDFEVVVTPQGWDAVLYIWKDCSEGISSCLHATDEGWTTPERLSLRLEVGHSYAIVVDGHGNSFGEAGSYELQIHDCATGACSCTPTCAENTCGPNGCGGYCGFCADPAQSCIDGSCQ